MALAIAVLTLAALWSGSKPKERPEKWEKAEIMEQLLALSDGETGPTVKIKSARLHVCAPRTTKRTGNSQLKRPAKTTLRIRSKTM